MIKWADMKWKHKWLLLSTVFLLGYSLGVHMDPILDSVWPINSVYAQNARGIGFTKTFSVGNTTYVAITANTACRNITVGEDRSAGGFPTADFFVDKPSTGNTPRQVASGTTYSFMGQSNFQPGDIVGYVKLVSGSSTFFQDESPT